MSLSKFSCASSPPLGSPPGSAPARRKRASTLGTFAALGLASLLSTGLSCGGRESGEQNLDPDNPDAPRLVSLTIRPTNDIFLVDLNTEATKQFTVRGLFSDGGSADFTRKVKWSLDNTTVGKFTSNTFKSVSLDKNKVDFTKVFAKITTETGQNLATVAGLTVVL